jgi:uncharacterized protein YecE (DUF72 family)
VGCASIPWRSGITVLTQQSLFVGGEPVPENKTAGAVAAQAQAPEQHALAKRLPASVYFGTSSWSFPGWRGLVYQGDNLDETRLARQGLASYAQHPLLRAVGVDRGFYAPVPKSTLQRWFGEVPEDFRFLLKAHAALTTPKTARRPAFLQAAPQVFLDPAYACKEIIEPAQQALRHKLGVILFQFSPLGERVWRYRRELLERLDQFLSELPLGSYAFEWRDVEIFGDDYAEVLARHGAIHGLAAHPRLPSLTQQARGLPVSGPLVIRWLLARNLAYQEARQRFAPFDQLCEPDESTRQEIVGAVKAAVASGREAIVIINNKAEGSAPLSVTRLAETLG